jgi:hypothetical protein
LGHSASKEKITQTIDYYHFKKIYNDRHGLLFRTRTPGDSFPEIPRRTLRILARDDRHPGAIYDVIPNKDARRPWRNLGGWVCRPVFAEWSVDASTPQFGVTFANARSAD